MDLLEYYMIEAIMSKHGETAILVRVMARCDEEAFSIVRRLAPGATKYVCVGCVA